MLHRFLFVWCYYFGRNYQSKVRNFSSLPFVAEYSFLPFFVSLKGMLICYLTYLLAAQVLPGAAETEKAGGR